MSQKRLLVYGDIEMDILLKTGVYDPRSHDVKVGDISFSPGGSAANCAAIAGSLGRPVTFLGSLGRDDWGALLRRDLRRHKVNIAHLKLTANASGTCVAVVDQNGERRFFSYRGANESAPPEIPPDSVWKRHACLHLSGYSFQEPNSRQAAWNLLAAAQKHGLAISLDPAYLFAKEGGHQLERLLPQLDFFFPNREEAALVSGEDDPESAARVLLARGVKNVLLTLGQEGCLLLSRNTEKKIRLNPLAEVVDTTGAGDAFCGGFLSGWLRGFSLEEACKLGCAASVHIITRVGAHEHAATKNEIIQILRSNQEADLAEHIQKNL